MAFVGTTTVQAIYLVASLSSAALAYIVWRHREKTGATPLFVAICGAWWWSTTLFLATVVGDYGLSVFLVRNIYPGVVVAVAAIFLFALEYTGREHLINRRVIALLAVEPVIVVVLAYTNPGNLFFTSISPDPASATGMTMEFGIAFLVHTVYSYALTIAVGVMILGLVFRTRALYRGQLVVLISAVVLPLFPNLAAIMQVLSFDATPLGFLVANTLYTVAIVRYRLIDLAPIARDRVVNSVNDGMFVVDRDHRIVDVNPAGEDLAEEYVGESDLIGENARDLLELVPELGTLYDDIVASGEEQTVEYDIGGRHYQATATPIYDTRDRTVGWLFLIRDVTERERQEQELRARNEKLDKFASVVSHDLRNPLQIASGRVELARQTGDVEHLEDVETALDRMEAIIDDVLSLARGGDEPTDLSPVAVRTAAETAWANVETTDAALNVRTDARITADHDRFVRLLENLFRNAVEHGLEESPTGATEAATSSTEAGAMALNDASQGPSSGESRSVTADGADVKLTVEVGVVSEGGDPVGIYVADDGPGIPPEDRDAIFESGYSTSPGGTGFGLTIVSQIAEVHGWSTHATESDTGGARFELKGAEIVGA